MINRTVKAQHNSIGNPLSVSRMATASRQSLSASEGKKIPPRPLPISKTSKNTPVTSGKTVDPLEKRLNHIRVHLLNNRIQRKPIPHEPTLIFENFLYLGGLKSLYDKVSFFLF